MGDLFDPPPPARAGTGRPAEAPSAADRAPDLPPAGAAPDGGTPTDVARAGTASHGRASGVAAPSGAAPDGATRAEVTPDGATPGEVATSRASPAEASPAEAAPDGAAPGRASPHEAVAAAPARRQESGAPPAGDAGPDRVVALDSALGPAAEWPLGCLPEPWARALRPRLAGEMPRLAALRAAQRAELLAGAAIHPAPGDWFAALAHTPPDRVRAVILGQDPYHGPGQAQGLSFSVRPGVPLPSSLRNVFKERRDDLGIPVPRQGSLVAWAERGVLLLNTVLSVAEGAANSHARRGWEGFTDAVIHVVNEAAPHAVFLLWGAHAQRKAGFVDETRHLAIRSAHPSGLSAHRGFFGSRPFSRANAFLESKGLDGIDWQS